MKGVFSLKSYKQSQSLEDICFFHNIKKSLSFKESVLNLGGVVWETCLRQLAFFDPSLRTRFLLLNESFSHLDFLEGKKAYQFLLEILCGLHSPIIAETEVLGQFKKWMEKEKKNKVLKTSSSLWQFLIRDVKNIRHEYLRKVGRYSYGSLLRQESSSFSSVEILGTGFLTEKILPWFETCSITLYCRNLNQGKLLQKKFPKLLIEVRNFPFKGVFKNSLVIVAAPLSSKDLKAWFQDSSIGLVFDLRSREEKDFSLSLSTPLKTLNDIKEKNKRLQKKSLPQIQQAFKAVHQKAEDFSLKLKSSPFGWEDVAY